MPGITDVLSNNTLSTRAANSKTNSKGSTTTAGSNLSMADFYKLMAAQLRYQDADNPMDTSAMMSQMVQAQMIQTMVQMNQVSVTTYAASLVGKEVTMGEINAEGFTGKTTLGTVTGVSMFEGEPTIFVDGKGYYMSQLLYVGKGPEAGKPGEDGDKDEDKTEGTGGVEGPGGAEGENGTGGVEGENGTGGVEGPGGAEGENGTGGTEGPGGAEGENGTGGAEGENGTGGTEGENGTGDAGTNGTGATDGSGDPGTGGTAGAGGNDSGSGQPETPGTESGTETGSEASGYSI